MNRGNESDQFSAFVPCEAPLKSLLLPADNCNWEFAADKFG